MYVIIIVNVDIFSFDDNHNNFMLCRRCRLLEDIRDDFYGLYDPATGEKREEDDDATDTYESNTWKHCEIGVVKYI